MRKISLLITISILISIIASAQISKGSIWLGGNIGFNSSEDEGPSYYEQTNIFISPAIGLAVGKNTIAGVQANITLGESNSNNIEHSNSNYGADVFLRKYWAIINRFYAFGHFRGGYTSINEEIKGTNYLQEMNGWTTSISASPGLSFALNKRFHLESAFYNLFYFAYTQKQTDLTNNLGKATYDSHSIGGGVILENVSYFNLGFRFILNK